MLLHLSVILFTRGGVHPQVDTPLPGRHSQARHLLPWADTPKTDTPWADTTIPDGHCSGQYASYWNAFLFIFKTLARITK